MADFIYSVSNTTLFLIISAIIVGLSLTTTVLSRRIFTVDQLKKENSGIARANSVVSGVYSILVGFAIYGLFHNFHDAEFNTYHEADSLKNINIYSKNLSGTTHSLIEEQVKKYAQIVIYKDWPAMAKGELIGDESGKAIQDIRHILFNHPVTIPIQKAMVNNILEEIKNLCRDRDERINLSTKSLRKEISITAFCVSLLCIFLSSINGMRLNIHLTCSLTVCFAISFTLFLMVALDRPFSGPFSVQPDPFQRILYDAGQSPNGKEI